MSVSNTMQFDQNTSNQTREALQSIETTIRQQIQSLSPQDQREAYNRLNQWSQQQYQSQGQQQGSQQGSQQARGAGSAQSGQNTPT